MKNCLCFIAMTGSIALGADKYAIESAGSSTAGQIKVRFADSGAPSSAEAVLPQHWAVDAITTEGIVPGRIVDSPTIKSEYATIPLVRLVVKFPVEPGWSPAFPAGTVRYRVTYSQSGELCSRTELITKPEDSDSKTNRDNDLTLFGGTNSAVGSKPTFKIDAAMDFHPLRNGFGVIAKAKTDNRRKVDPDSFAAKLDYRYLLSAPRPGAGEQIVFQGAELQLDYAGLEFDRKGENLNFVSSPYLLLSFDFHTSAAGSIANVVGLDLKLGFEAGRNFSNSLNQAGYGGFFRTLAGGAAKHQLPHRSWICEDCRGEQL